jgi:hypothetical protein
MALRLGDYACMLSKSSATLLNQLFVGCSFAEVEKPNLVASGY